MAKTLTLLLEIILSATVVYVTIGLAIWCARYLFLMLGNYKWTLFALRLQQRLRWFRHDAHFFLGLTLYLANEPQQAEIALQKCLEAPLSMKQRVMTLNNLALVLQAQGRYEEAIQTATVVTTMLPTADFGFGTLGWIHMNSGDVEMALRFAQQAIDEWSTCRVLNRHTRAINYALFGWATATLNPEQIELASESAHHAVRLASKLHMKPARANIHYCAGSVWRLLGDFEAAANHYKTAVQLDPKGYYGHVSLQALAAGKSKMLQTV